MSAAPKLLAISRNGQALRSVPIDGEAVAGRGDDCVIRLDDRAISRRHAVFRAVAGEIQVERQSEFAPLRLNGAECTRALLKDGDVIEIGPFALRLVPSGPAAGGGEPLDIERTPGFGGASGRGAPLAVEAPAGEPATSALAAPDAAAGDLPESIDPFASAAPAGEEASLPGTGAGGTNLLALGPPSDMAGAPAFEPAPESALPVAETPSELIADDAKTKLTPSARLIVKLVFEPGAANVEEFEITEDEVSLGRGKNCDIVLNDKKVSRKNTLIRRAGMSFLIKDLESANGTYVNGERVTEREIVSDDVIRIGNIEFRFKALSADYAAKAKDLVSPPASFEPEAEAASSDAGLPMDPGADYGTPGYPVGNGALAPAGLTDGSTGASGLLGSIAGIAGLGANGKLPANATLIEKFKALPRNRQIIWGVIVLALVYFLMFDEDPPPQKAAPKAKAAPSAQVSGKPGLSFEGLSPEQRKFVETEHQLAFDYYRAGDFEKALFELNKLFAVIPDYLDSRAIERYATEGKRKKEAIEEEKRKHEEAERLKAKVTSLIEECRGLMKQKRYPQAQELFTQVLVMDPDNADVAKWRQELQEIDEQNRSEDSKRRAREEINARAGEIFKQGRALMGKERYQAAISAFGRVLQAVPSDRRLLGATRGAISQCRKLIAEKRDPMLADAKAAEDAGDLPKAFGLYERATQVDSHFPAGFAGMDRIRGVLHDRAKVIYTEAVLAESYSDFSIAKKKYADCMSVAPKDDIYYERAQRKLSRFFKTAPASLEGSGGGGSP